MATKPALMNLPIETSDAGFYSGFSKDVTISAKILVTALIIWAVVFPENASNVLSALNSFLLSNFASWYIFVVAFYVVVCLLFTLVSSSGKLLLGRPGKTPEFSNFSWFSMMFGAGIGILWVPRLLRFDPYSTTLNHETGFLLDLPIMADSVSTGFYGPLETGSYPPKLTRENK